MHPAHCYSIMTQALRDGELSQARVLAMELRICLDEQEEVLSELPVAEIRHTTEWVLRRLTHLP